MAEKTDTYKDNTPHIMKKTILLIIVTMLMCPVMKSNEAGHFFVDLRTAQVSLSDVANAFDTYTSIAEGSTFELFRDTTDGLGIQHLSYQQYYQGMKVQDHMILVHASKGMVQTIHGHVMPASAAPSSQIKSKAGKPMFILHAGKYYQVYRVPCREKLEVQYVDVATGEIIYRESALHEADVKSEGTTRYYGKREMTVNHREGKYYLEDSGRNMRTLSASGVELNPYFNSDEFFMTLPDSVQSVLTGQAQDMSRLVDYLYEYLYGPMAKDYLENRAILVYSEGPELDFSSLDDVTPREYCDIHWGMQQTIDFYRTTFGRNSFDGKGYPIYNVAFPSAHPFLFPKMPGNASAQCAFEPFYMFYGEGDGEQTKPVVSLDVMAHEYTHLVTACNGNGSLVYKGESGALNESFSDCMAMGVFQFTFDSCRWSIGDEVTIKWPNMRDMADPNNSRGAACDSASRAQPDTYKGMCWWDTSNPTADNDQGGVHVNSGVQNYWFYLLCEGGRGTNDLGHDFEVKAIGMDKALQIVYRNLIFYLTPQATYEDARQGALCAATDLYGADSPEYISVMNGWYAVGVGEAYRAQEGLSAADAYLPAPTKRIQDGHVLIQRGEKVYTLTGQEVR